MQYGVTYRVFPKGPELSRHREQTAGPVNVEVMEATAKWLATRFEPVGGMKVSAFDSSSFRDFVSNIRPLAQPGRALRHRRSFGVGSNPTWPI